MSKHTPGPWEVDTHDSWGGAVYVMYADERTIAEVRPFSDKEDREKGGNIDADARLIAAAPDLLDALQNILSHWSDLYPKDRQQAQEAIAKALGQPVTYNSATALANKAAAAPVADDGPGGYYYLRHPETGQVAETKYIPDADAARANQEFEIFETPWRWVPADPQRVARAAADVIAPAPTLADNPMHQLASLDSRRPTVGEVRAQHRKSQGGGNDTESQFLRPRAWWQGAGLPAKDDQGEER
jgi:hypothetical protein